MAKKNKTHKDILNDTENILNRLNDLSPITAEDLQSLRNNNQSLRKTINGMNWVIDIIVVFLFVTSLFSLFMAYETYNSLNEDEHWTQKKIEDSLTTKYDSINNTLSDSLRYDLIKEYQDVLNENFKLKNEIFNLKDSIYDFKVFYDIAKENYKLKYKKVNKGKTITYSVDSDYFEENQGKIIDHNKKDSIKK